MGCAPVVRRIRKRRAVSSLVAVTAPLDPRDPPRLYARHCLESLRTAHVITMLRYLRARVGPLVIVWDHLTAHRSKRVRAFLARHPKDFQVEWLPGYPPELNLEEQCNNCVKLAMLNAVPTSVDELRHSVRVNFQRLGRKPHLLHHFFQHAGLNVT